MAASSSVTPHTFFAVLSCSMSHGNSELTESDNSNGLFNFGGSSMSMEATGLSSNPSEYGT